MRKNTKNGKATIKTTAADFRKFVDRCKELEPVVAPDWSVEYSWDKMSQDNHEAACGVNRSAKSAIVTLARSYTQSHPAPHDPIACAEEEMLHILLDPVHEMAEIGVPGDTVDRIIHEAINKVRRLMKHERRKKK